LGLLWFLKKVQVKVEIYCSINVYFFFFVLLADLQSKDTKLYMCVRMYVCISRPVTYRNVMFWAMTAQRRWFGMKCGNRKRHRCQLKPTRTNEKYQNGKEAK
jgi:hypothetical protein